MNDNIFRKRLKELRTEKGLKAKELAKILDCVPTTITNYETGYRTPDYENLISLADFFQTTTDYLLGRTAVKGNDCKENRTNYETKYAEMKNTLFSAVKESADVLLKLLREDESDTRQFETARHCYSTLWEQVKRNDLVVEYEAWEWAMQDGDEE